MKHGPNLRQYRLEVLGVDLAEDRPAARRQEGTQPVHVNGIEVVANGVGDLALRPTDGVRIPFENVNVRLALLRPTGDRDNDAGVMEAGGGPNDDTRMLALELWRIGVVREVNPVILPNARPTLDLSDSPALSNPTRRVERLVRRKVLRRIAAHAPNAFIARAELADHLDSNPPPVKGRG